MFIAIERAGRLGGVGLAEILPADAPLSAIVLAELRVGLLAARSQSQREAAEEYLELVVSRLPALPFGAQEARVWADLFVELRTAGRLPGERDLQIAASALAGGHAVLTSDVSDFERVSGLRVIPWLASRRG